MSAPAGSAGRRRMVALASSTMLYVLVDSGFAVVGPLWATRDLGLANADWAFLRSASELGGFASVLAFGLLSERAGTRRMAALALCGAGFALAGMAFGLWIGWLIALYGALVSGVYVNFNVLAQRVSGRRTQAANAIYRAAGVSATILAPVLATRTAQELGSYGPVLLGGALLLGLAGAVILAFSEPSPAALTRSFSATWASYRRCFTSRPLLAFVAVTRSFGAVIAAVGVFAALRLTRQLGLSETDFGLLASCAALASLLVVLAGGWLVGRLRPSRTLAIAWLGCSLAAVTMGLSDSLPLAVGAYAIYAPLLTLCSVPLSLWANRFSEEGRETPPAQGAVFPVLKLFQTGINMLVIAVLGVLEPLVGMGTLMWSGGLIGVPLAFAVARLGARHRI